MRKTALRSLAVALALIAVGCGSSPGLSVVGSVDVEADGAHTGFSFPQPARLDGAGSGGVVTGSCSLSHYADGHYGAVIELFGSSSAEGRALRSISFLTRSDSPGAGRVDAELGASAFTGACDVTLARADDRGVVAIEVESCSIASGAETASVNASLTFENCVLLSE